MAANATLRKKLHGRWQVALVQVDGVPRPDLSKRTHVLFFEKRDRSYLMYAWVNKRLKLVEGGYWQLKGNALRMLNVRGKLTDFLIRFKGDMAIFTQKKVEMVLKRVPDPKEP